MDFTSGRAVGPRLDNDALAHGDLRNNVWGTLLTATGPRQAAELFRAAGWAVRRSSWTEFEAEHTFAQLEVLPTDPVTFSGFVDPDRVGVLLQALATMGTPYSIEYEDPEGRENVYRSGSE